MLVVPLVRIIEGRSRKIYRNYVTSGLIEIPLKKCIPSVRKYDFRDAKLEEFSSQDNDLEKPLKYLGRHRNFRKFCPLEFVPVAISSEYRVSPWKRGSAGKDTLEKSSGVLESPAIRDSPVFAGNKEGNNPPRRLPTRKLYRCRTTYNPPCAHRLTLK